MSAEGAQAVADGALYLVQQPMSLAVLAAVSLVTRDLPRRQAVASLALFALAATITLALEPAAWNATFVAACLAALGAFCAAALRPTRLWLQVVCAMGGLALGLSAGVPVALPGEAIGTLAMTCLLLAAVHAGWRLVGARWPRTPVLQTAPRVIAAWLSAIGWLMLALEFFRG